MKKLSPMLLLCLLLTLCACGDRGHTAENPTEATFHDRSHHLIEVTHRAPTEYEEGNYLYYRCADCGELFWEFTGKTPATLEEVTVPALGPEPYEMHRFNGEDYSVTRLNSFYGHAAQGSAIDGNTLFVCNKYGYCYMYDLTDGSKIAEFPLGSFDDSDSPTQNHSNQMMFGAEKFAESDPYPLLYVTTGYSNDHDENGTYYCRGSVERIRQRADGSWYAEIVQTIEFNDAANIPDKDPNGTLKKMYRDGKFLYVSGNGYDASAGYEKIGYGWPHFYVDSAPTAATEGKLFIFSTRFRGSEYWENKTREQYGFDNYEKDNAYIISEFTLPELPASESAADGYGQTVTLYPRDIRDQFTTEFSVFAFQGGTMYRGRIYHSFGDAKQTEKHTDAIGVWDIAQRRFVTKIDLRRSILADWEPECCCIYNGELALSAYNMNDDNRIVNLYLFGYITADDKTCLPCGEALE